ncbi:epoxide hydrolase 4-like [Elysia marginata]|uniref:Epoxide hydrolase 4-like n=1 Tax=Elysia marginata TaxID=1093978 RepID=A0AAV4J7R9_9GAST|nr:epoxide hydrolase 4-like [Elysia marginata]
MARSCASMLSMLVDFLSLWSLAAIYGMWAFFAVIVMSFRVGFRTLFNWKVFEKPACLDDKALGTHGYLHLEDVRLHYVASGPEDKPLMLFMHGFPELWFSWRHQIKEFQKDYRVVAFDMRGYNESDKPKGLAAYSLHKLMADVKQVILELGYKSCVLVAHDWGGVIAWPFARLNPDYVDKLVIINAPPGHIMARLLTVDAKQRKMSWYLFLFQLPLFPELLLKLQNFRVIEKEFQKTGISQEELNVYKYAVSQPGALTPVINYYRSVLRQTGGAVTHDINYPMPVLLIWGCKDKFLSTDIPDMIEKENPRITVKRITRATHFVQNHDPMAVNKIMREWLAD